MYWCSVGIEDLPPVFSPDPDSPSDPYMDLGEDVEEMNLNVLFAESNDSPHNGSSRERQVRVGPGRDRDSETEVTSGKGVTATAIHTTQCLTGKLRNLDRADIHSTAAPPMVMRAGRKRGVRTGNAIGPMP